MPLRTFYRGPLSRTLAVVAGSLLVFFVNLFAIYHFALKEVELPRDALLNVPSEYREKIDLYSCSIEDPLAVSALARVKTEQCRLKITEAACKLKSKLFHDAFPTSLCENHDNDIVGSHVGCFADSVNERTLSEFSYTFKEDNSMEKCRAHCYRAGYLYYGLEFARECFCGDHIARTAIDGSKCANYTCPGNSTQSCGGFNAIDVYRTGLKTAVARSKPTYMELPASDFKSDIVIMFLLQLNGRNERQVKRLLKSIYSPKHLYYIHVDQRQLYMLTEMKAVAAKLPNVYIAPDGHSTIWGGASLLTMVQACISRSLSLPGFKNWDYLVNLSESDYPVLSIRELEYQLESHRGMSFLSNHGYNTGRFIQKQGFDFVFLECEERMWRIGKRDEFPDNIRIDGGSDWIILHRDFAEYSIASDELPTKLRNLFSSIILPVESFFHTLSYNSRFCDTIVNGNLRLTNWNRKQGCRCASLKKVVDWCGCSPLVFKKEHIHKFALEKAKEKAYYFARKFESLIDIDSVAEAEQQAMRFRPDAVNRDHVSFNSTFVNFYKADIDGYSRVNTMLSEYILSLHVQHAADFIFVSLERIDVFRANSKSRHELVFTLQVRDVKTGQLTTLQLLVHRQFHAVLSNNAVTDGFRLMNAHVGVNIDHKEEIFRGFTGYIETTGSPILALRWRRELSLPTTVNETKTSPAVRVAWYDASGKNVALQQYRSYDSINGIQHADIDLTQFNVTPEQSGMWSVIISAVPPGTTANPQGERLAKVSVPIFTPSQPEVFKNLTSQAYTIQDSCVHREKCKTKIWSTLFPDPKSDILYGYDNARQLLL